MIGIPPDPIFMYSANEIPQAKRLIPPNPAAQPGCPDNPQQVGIRMATPAYVMPNFGEVLQALGLRAIGFGFASMYGLGMDALGPHPAIKDLPELDRDYSLASVQWICDRPNASVIEADGVKTCRWPPQVPEPATAYIVDPSRYSTPAGDPFRIDCGRDAFGRGMGPCDKASYPTTLGLRIGYSFRPATSIFSAHLIDRVISFDRQVRAALAAAVIPNYPWRNLPSSKSSEK